MECQSLEPSSGNDIHLIPAF